MYFSHICHFRPMTQPTHKKTQIFDPFPTQPNPTRGSTQPMDNSAMYVVNRTKIANFPTPRVFNAPDEWVPRGILYRRRGLKKLE